ncbi:hypothetical protein NDU88_003741 [Pleurodeles waltl]|uniref:Uncharacterized protein n=1 Tax=Pleurodeles waltl TaxID=8319 RepID=A0AAV7WVP3_PLEWA|nr:hypothetical protein NDU88_003741 [Pleurodeles waltl]
MKGPAQGWLAVPLLLDDVPAQGKGGLQKPSTTFFGVAGLVVAEVFVELLRDGGGGSGEEKRSTLERKIFFGAMGRVAGVGMGVEEEDVVVGESSVLSLGAGAWAGG